MDVKTFSDQLQNRMNEQIEAVREKEDDELATTAKIIQIVRGCIFELKQFIHQYEFKDQEEEIHFFKAIKPKFLSLYFYCDQVLSLSIKTSMMDIKDKKKYYRKMLRCIQKFQEQNIVLYQYWLTGNVYLDDQYFVRRRRTVNNPNLDETFSTGYDIKLARLLVHEELKEYLCNALKNRETKPKLKWTGSKTAMIELIYGLQTVGVFNNATSDVKQIATCFEEFFGIKLGNFYDTFQEIRIRKKNVTKFIDQMRESLLLRANSVDSL
jgi:hypothetical protein